MLSYAQLLLVPFFFTESKSSLPGSGIELTTQILEENWKVRSLKESDHMLGYGKLLSRPKIEITMIWEKCVSKASNAATAVRKGNTECCQMWQTEARVFVAGKCSLKTKFLWIKTLFREFGDYLCSDSWSPVFFYVLSPFLTNSFFGLCLVRTEKKRKSNLIPLGQ